MIKLLIPYFSSKPLVEKEKEASGRSNDSHEEKCTTVSRVSSFLR